MAENLDDGEFWLPPQFLADDDIALEKKKTIDGFNLKKDSKALFPCEFPFGFGFSEVPSDLSSPVESVVGSSETESDEEEHLAELTRQMAHSTLEVDFNHAFGSEKSMGLVVSGSPQSTLCAFGNGCGCRNKGSSHGSPECVCNFSSERATWDLLHAAAGEVERMRLCEEAYGFNHNRGVMGPSRNPSPVTLPVNNSISGVGFYTQQSLSHQQLQIAQFQMLKQQQKAKQQKNLVWGGQTNPSSGVYQSSQMVPSRGRNVRPLGLSSAWPTLPQMKQQNQQYGSGMRAVFLGNSSGKRECAGTGVFLPRRVDNPPETRKKPSCSTVLVPARVAQALNSLKVENMVGSQPLQQPQFYGNSNMENVATAKLRSNYGFSHQKRNNLKPQMPVNNEIRLPQEWSY